MTELERAFALDPRNPNLALTMGQVETLLRRYERAEGYIDTAIALAPADIVGYFHKSLTHLLWKGSVPEARAILAAAPPTDDPFVALAFYWLDVYERHYDSALARLATIHTPWFREADDVYPRALLVGQLRRLRGERPLAKAAFEEARRLLEREVAAHPRDARLRSSLGIAYAGLGRREEAVREGRLGVELAPVAADAINGTQRVSYLAQIYSMLGDGAAASEPVAFLLSHPALVSVSSIDLDPIWDPVRNDPTFRRDVHPGS